MYIKTYVKDLDIPVGESRRINCPVCKSYKTFTATNNMGHYCGIVTKHLVVLVVIHVVMLLLMIYVRCLVRKKRPKLGHLNFHNT